MQLYYEPITEAMLTEFIARAYEEDVRTGDHSALACIPAESRSRAVLKVKQDGVLAGVAVAEAFMRAADPTAQIKMFLPDGCTVKAGEIAFEVTMNTRALLKAERPLLNTMQRMSGIATLSRRLHDTVSDLPVQILDTRKTTPTLRFLEKAAVRMGGCVNYRYGLYDRIMLKDNHIDAAGGIAAAIARTQAYISTNPALLQSLEITIEVRTLDELQTVLATGGVHCVMLDNFSLDMLHAGVKMVAGRYDVEASGGITLANLRDVALTGVNFISVGAITHSAGCLDLSLKVVQ